MDVAYSSGFTWIGELNARTAEVTNRVAIMRLNPTSRTARTATLENGTEFHGYKAMEASVG